MWNWLKRAWGKLKRLTISVVRTLLGSLVIMLPAAAVVAIGLRIFRSEDPTLIMAWSWAFLIVSGAVLLLVGAFVLAYALIEHINEPKSPVE